MGRVLVSSIPPGLGKLVVSWCCGHRQPNLNIREPLNYKDFYGNTTDLCQMVETNIVLSIKST